MLGIKLPITVGKGPRRTFSVKAPGIRATLTTSISGFLLLRRKLFDEIPVGVPYYRQPGIDPPLEKGPAPLLHPVDLTEIHNTLVSSGIKVQDFAYSPLKVGHRCPVDPDACLPTKEGLEHMAERRKTLPANAADPLPPYPMSDAEWEPTDPRILPNNPPPIRTGPVVVPTDTPFERIYPTHRITARFDPVAGVREHDFRLSQYPRTYPIRGRTTRRLLTLAPGWVDLSQYTEADFDELRRYDAILLRQSLTEEGVYPWVTIGGWSDPPTAEDRASMQEHENMLRFDMALEKAARIIAHKEELVRVMVEETAREAKARGKKRVRDDGGGEEQGRAAAKRRRPLIRSYAHADLEEEVDEAEASDVAQFLCPPDDPPPKVEVPPSRRSARKRGIEEVAVEEPAAGAGKKRTRRRA
ncbi:hypothetical protein B0H10DRAFT_1976128 [Mycena sp. CBHHK59/15]|nr:hypothetical protein B0H10DRAFT_1976128 [Mycena sp. CBHHK59/15]